MSSIAASLNAEVIRLPPVPLQKPNQKEKKKEKKIPQNKQTNKHTKKIKLKKCKHDYEQERFFTMELA